MNNHEMTSNSNTEKRPELRVCFFEHLDANNKPNQYSFQVMAWAGKRDCGTFWFYEYGPLKLASIRYPDFTPSILYVWGRDTIKDNRQCIVDCGTISEDYDWCWRAANTIRQYNGESPCPGISGGSVDFVQLSAEHPTCIPNTKTVENHHVASGGESVESLKDQLFRAKEDANRLRGGVEERVHKLQLVPTARKSTDILGTPAKEYLLEGENGLIDRLVVIRGHSSTMDPLVLQADLDKRFGEGKSLVIQVPAGMELEVLEIKR